MMEHLGQLALLVLDLNQLSPLFDASLHEFLIGKLDSDTILARKIRCRLLGIELAKCHEVGMSLAPIHTSFAFDLLFKRALPLRSLGRNTEARDGAPRLTFVVTGRCGRRVKTV